MKIQVSQASVVDAWKEAHVSETEEIIASITAHLSHCVALQDRRDDFLHRFPNEQEDEWKEHIIQLLLHHAILDRIDCPGLPLYEYTRNGLIRRIHDILKHLYYTDD